MAFLFLRLNKLLICTVVGINDKGFALVRVPRNDVDKICDERGHLAFEHPRVAPDHVLFVHVGVILLLHHCGPQVFILSTNISRRVFFSCEKIAFCLLSSPQAMFASLPLFITWALEFLRGLDKNWSYLTFKDPTAANTFKVCIHQKL